MDLEQALCEAGRVVGSRAMNFAAFSCFSVFADLSHAPVSAIFMRLLFDDLTGYLKRER